MAKITMELIKELRDKTQVGMMTCKTALIESEGDIEKAIEILRKKGASVAAKRASHATNNGTISVHISPDSTIGALVEIGCETDFSANTPDMQTFAKTVGEHLAGIPECCQDRCEPECLIKQTLFNDKNKTIKSLLDELIAKIAENIKISRCARFDVAKEGLVNAYIHPGATLAAMLELEVEGLNDTNKETLARLAKDLCMQITVTNPLAITPAELDPQAITKEENFIKEQMKDAANKPPEILEKILTGKMNKYYEEVCLTKQKYIKQDKITIAKHIQAVAKETGCTITVKQFKRFAIGG